MKENSTVPDALTRLKGLRDAGQESVLVSYSGGKDSLCVLDMATRIFKKVVCFFMYFIPGLECCETQLEYARKRYGVSIIQYPHWSLAAALREALYSDPSYKLDRLPKLSLYDIFSWVMQDTGIKKILAGNKNSDSVSRRYILKSWAQGDYADVLVNPIINWNKYDVLSYLRVHDIPVPPASSGNTTGIGLSEVSLLWLHDTFPKDFAKLLRLFPYAEAVVKRREFYGNKS